MKYFVLFAKDIVTYTSDDSQPSVFLGIFPTLEAAQEYIIEHDKNPPPGYNYPRRLYYEYFVYNCDMGVHVHMEEDDAVFTYRSDFD